MKNLTYLISRNNTNITAMTWTQYFATFLELYHNETIYFFFILRNHQLHILMPEGLRTCSLINSIWRPTNS
jgi:hypothetical protein